MSNIFRNLLIFGKQDRSATPLLHTSQGFLFEPRNQHENDQVSNLVLNAKEVARRVSEDVEVPYDFWNFWIGLYDLTPGYDFRFMYASNNDSSLTFENWDTENDQPAFVDSSKAGVQVNSKNGKWETDYPVNWLAYVCEKPYRRSEGEGANCDCPDGFFLSSGQSCESCQCSQLGSREVCDKRTGKCNCHSNFEGKNCDVCKAGYHGNKCELMGESEEQTIFTGPCSVNCGSGTQLVMSKDCWKTVTEELVCSDSIKTRVEPCSRRPCRGLYGDWTAWTPCSKTCLQSLNETSQRIRSRLCISVDQSQCETGCETGEREIQICNEVGLCPKIGKLLLKIVLYPKSLKLFCF